MTSRIGENPRPGGLIGLVIRFARAQFQQPGLGIVQIHEAGGRVAGPRELIPRLG